MSASYVREAAPPNALKVWCDARYIYVELPTKITAPACVVTYPRTGKGLDSLLGLIYGHSDNSGLMPENFKPGRKTTPQSALAESILRRQGILK